MYRHPKKSGPPLLRLGHPMAFSAFLRHIGAPADRYLRSQKLPVLCDDPDRFVPLARAWAFFDTAARHEDLMLGWLVGAHVGDHNLNAGLLRKLETAPTLFQALQRLVKLASAEASHIQIGISERSDDILFYTRYSGMKEVPGYMSSQSYQLGLIRDLIRHFLGQSWSPDEIGIEHSVVTAVMEELFPGSRILTQQPMGYIAVPRNCLHQAARTLPPTGGMAGDPVLSENFDYLYTLRALLRSYLPDGYTSAQFAASLMDTSERTLARRLAAHGLTYRSLIDDLRFTEAKKLLREPGMRIEEIAQSVGFEDQSNFTRMFRRISGLTPKEFRKASLL
jgi:AraC-like DNA-binding protein